MSRNQGNQKFKFTNLLENTRTSQITFADVLRIRHSKRLMMLFDVLRNLKLSNDNELVVHAEPKNTSSCGYL